MAGLVGGAGCFGSLGGGFAATALYRLVVYHALAAARVRGSSFVRMKTFVAKPSDRQRDWYVVDANGKTLGRLATQIADVLRGKRKPTYTPEERQAMVGRMHEHLAANRDVFAYFKHEETPEGVLYAQDVLATACNR